MPYLTAGDPDIATTGQLLQALQAAGAMICELGIPFSDPIADGPVIQASMAHALDNGLRTQQVFDTVAEHRSSLSMGLVAMVSYSIVHRHGDAFLADAKQAGFDGFIIPDLPVEESEQTTARVREAGLICSCLIAPTTPIERAQQIAKTCSGFVYLLSRSGITGEKSELPSDLPDRVKALRDVTDLPIAVGFGISSADQVRQVVSVADAAIVGSAIMRRIATVREQGTDAVIRDVEQFVTELSSGLAGATQLS